MHYWIMTASAQKKSSKKALDTDLLTFHVDIQRLLFKSDFFVARRQFFGWNETKWYVIIWDSLCDKFSCSTRLVDNLGNILI